MQTVAISFHPDRRWTKRCGRGEALNLPGYLDFPPMCGDFLPIAVTFLGVCRTNNRQHRFPADGHFFHDCFERLTCANVFWLERTCARVESEWGNGRKGEGTQNQQNRTRKYQHRNGSAYNPADISRD